MSALAVAAASALADVASALALSALAEEAASALDEAAVVAEVVAEEPVEASSRIAFTALKMALEVTDAPETPSTPSVPLASTIFAGSCSMALEPTPSVSSLSPTVTSVILPPEMVTVTGTSPPMPLPEAS